MSYTPGPIPKPADIPEFLRRELARIAASVGDSAPRVFYRTLWANAGTLSAAVSANWKISAGNVIRISASVTQTLTGIVLSDPMPMKEIVLINVGTGVLALKSEGTESSASYRFALAANWQLSANAAGVFWYDPVSSRLRGIAKT